MTSQSLPPSSARSIMIMSQIIDLAGLAQPTRKVPWLCTTNWLETIYLKRQNLSSLLPTCDTKKPASHPQLGMGLGSLLTRSQTPGLLFLFVCLFVCLFFSATLAWTRAIIAHKSQSSNFKFVKDEWNVSQDMILSCVHVLCRQAHLVKKRRTSLDMTVIFFACALSHYREMRGYYGTMKYQAKPRIIAWEVFATLKWLDSTWFCFANNIIRL